MATARRPTGIGVDVDTRPLRLHLLCGVAQTREVIGRGCDAFFIEHRCCGDLNGGTDATGGAAMYSEVIMYADETFTDNRQVRGQSADLQAKTTALMVVYRAHRFPRLCGGSDHSVTDRVRHLLHDFCAGSAAEILRRPKCGSACQACGHVIEVGAIEYDVVVGTAELRLDADCYSVLMEESHGVNN